MTAPTQRALDTAQRWLDAEPDRDISEELAELIERRDPSLDERFAGRLQFGTAGLRAAVAAGSMRMNRLVVRQAAAGLARHLLATDGRAAERGVVVGRDSRRKSDLFALDTARALAAAGIRVHLFDNVVPTPVLAWSITGLDAAAGVMVTASHNPPADNGYKVYLDSGAQIVPPHDELISAAIGEVDPFDVPLASEDDPLITHLGTDLVEAYLDSVPAVRLRPEVAPVAVAYTAMHGVGGEVLVAAFERSGLGPPAVVEEQFEPDGTFPTVPFPNPEEPGAMDLVMALAERVGARLAIANDPDADRVGAAIPTRDGGWRRLGGDEIGWLLADHVLSHTSGDDRLVVSTLVSSSLVGRMAREAGVHFEESYTGFKWIADVARRFPDERLVFAYEQALGYLVGGDPLDKDGISAALMVVEIARLARNDGTTIEGRLRSIADRFGSYRTVEASIPLSPDRGTRVVANFEASPPSQIAGRNVASIEAHPEASLVRVLLEGPNSVRVQIRPSGTEPKVKLYGEAIDLDPTPFVNAVRDLLIETDRRAE